jgi:hypothetical protein
VSFGSLSPQGATYHLFTVTKAGHPVTSASLSRIREG